LFSRASGTAPHAATDVQGDSWETLSVVYSSFVSRFFCFLFKLCPAAGLAIPHSPVIVFFQVLKVFNDLKEIKKRVNRFLLVYTFF
jgi:hypothetical protein